MAAVEREEAPEEIDEYQQEPICNIPLNGCEICNENCPFETTTLVNLPSSLDTNPIHIYPIDHFKLHRLPTPRAGTVLGLVGANGTGKSTILKILSGRVKPNLGCIEIPPEWPEILTYFNDSELRVYFTNILENGWKAVFKPQYVDQISRTSNGPVRDLFYRGHLSENVNHVIEILELAHILERNIENLSGGELQRFSCAAVCTRIADNYMFDEPSTYLDIKQRFNIARAVRSLIHPAKHIVVVEHDLSVLGYLSDYICCSYGIPGVYGMVTIPFSVREGINIFLPTVNLRLHEDVYRFNIATSATEEETENRHHNEYPSMTKSLGEFELKVEAATFSGGEVIVLLGENGTGKTTLLRLLAGHIQPNEGQRHTPELNISYKPQKISLRRTGSVRTLLHEKIRDAYTHPRFERDVMKPLRIDVIMDREFKDLSGHELQCVALTLCLGKPADVYLIDEPSSYLDSEQRLVVAKVIKSFVYHAKTTAFVVEHDFVIATYLADRVIVFEGQPSLETIANAPQDFLPGVNRFLGSLDITFRRDPISHRPIVNKENSVEDMEQKRSGNFFFLED